MTKATTVTTNSFEETQAYGEEFARTLKGGDIVLLSGDLGSGKTTFVQGIARGLGVQKRVTSPTFLITKQYTLPSEVGANILFHVDLYRLSKVEEKDLQDTLEIVKKQQAILIIEWPEKLQFILPNSMQISLKTQGTTMRQILLHSIQNPQNRG